MIIEYFNIPNECLNHVCSFINDKEMIKLSAINKYFNKLADLKVLKGIYNTFFVEKYKHVYTFTKLLYDSHHDFNDYKILESIKHLYFRWDFNFKINVIPNHITHLYFENYFNKPLGKLSDSLVFIQFGLYYNQEIDGLPDSVQHIKFVYGHWFDKQIKKFPTNLKTMVLNNKYEHKHLIPKNVVVIYN